MKIPRSCDWSRSEFFEIATFAHPNLRKNKAALTDVALALETLRDSSRRDPQLMRTFGDAVADLAEAFSSQRRAIVQRQGETHTASRMMLLTAPFAGLSNDELARHALRVAALAVRIATEGVDGYPYEPPEEISTR